MQAFFSGTDTATLQSEGNDQNCFVSLIVNNKGTYCAAITRKVQSRKVVTTEYLGSSYDFFGDGTVQLTNSDVGEEEVSNTVIEYFMLDVEVEKAGSLFADIDARFEEIETRKHNADKPVGLLQTTSFTESSLFTKDELDDMTLIEPLNHQLIHKLVCQMITCSFIVNTDINLEQWITKHMVSKYDTIFTDSTFEDWTDLIVPFMLDNYGVLTKQFRGFDSYAETQIALAFCEELSIYPTNKYIEKYISVLKEYIYE